MSDQDDFWAREQAEAAEQQRIQAQAEAQRAAEAQPAVQAQQAEAAARAQQQAAAAHSATNPAAQDEQLRAAQGSSYEVWRLETQLRADSRVGGDRVEPVAQVGGVGRVEAGFDRHQADEDAKRQAEEDAKRQAEEDAKRQAEEDAKRQADEDAKRQADEDAKRQADEDREREERERARLAALKQTRIRLEQERDRAAAEAALHERIDSPTAVTPGTTGADWVAELRREMGLDENQQPVPRGAGRAARLALEEGLVGPRGAPGIVDLAVQHHGSASAVRKEYGVTGAEMQSAHIGPTSFLHREDGYSRSKADTVLLPVAVHQSLDRYWEDWAMEQRRQGRERVTVRELHDTMVEAIDQTEGLATETKAALAWKLHLELYSELELQPDQEIPLPYAREGTSEASPTGAAASSTNPVRSNLPSVQDLVGRSES
ncbi:hypothetical protein NOCA1130157 [metagenome]|uniref:Uncharacterized protein n=1 Tax=metagenome TaxID=256318 RepID=A0A2P2C6Q9_9ZZZZ